MPILVSMAVVEDQYPCMILPFISIILRDTTQPMRCYCRPSVVTLPLLLVLLCLCMVHPQHYCRALF